MADISEAIRNELEEGQRLRGWIVNAYAQVEYLLGDLILRCRAFPEYEEQTRTFTHSAPTRGEGPRHAGSMRATRRFRG